MTATETTSRQQRRTEQTRKRLLDAARAAFLEHGYDGVVTGEITKRADLGAGTYYLHFRDKRSLYEAFVRRELFALRRRWVDERAKKKLNGEPKTEISLMIEMVLQAVLADLDLARLILLDGPPLETFIVEDIGREIAGVLGSRFPEAELVSNLVVGAALNAGRWAVARPRGVSTKRLTAEVIAFCAAGVAATRKRRS